MFPCDGEDGTCLLEVPPAAPKTPPSEEPIPVAAAAAAAAAAVRPSLDYDSDASTASLPAYPSLPDDLMFPASPLAMLPMLAADAAGAADADEGTLITVVRPGGAQVVCAPNWNRNTVGDLWFAARVAWAEGSARRAEEADERCLSEVCQPGGVCTLGMPEDAAATSAAPSPSPLPSRRAPDARRVGAAVRGVAERLQAGGDADSNAAQVIRAAGLLQDPTPPWLLLPLLPLLLAASPQKEGLAGLLETLLEFYPASVVEYFLQRPPEGATLVPHLLRSGCFVHRCVSLSEKRQKPALLALVIDALNSAQQPFPRNVIDSMLGTIRLECPVELLQRFEGIPIKVT
eukprot:Rhum_TRINITY_DN8836_c0_g1::Rhum_TRINITY_DN8836_c0_g1_i1::g.29940::m.29940